MISFNKLSYCLTILGLEAPALLLPRPAEHDLPADAGGLERLKELLEVLGHRVHHGRGLSIVFKRDFKRFFKGISLFFTLFDSFFTLLLVFFHSFSRGLRREECVRDPHLARCQGVDIPRAPQVRVPDSRAFPLNLLARQRKDAHLSSILISYHIFYIISRL